MKVLLTGCNGNLGKHLRKYLSADEIINVGRSDWQNIEHLFEDGIDIVIHTGYEFRKSVSVDPYANLETNLMSTARLLELCEKKGADKFVFLSSCSVYGNTPYASENSPPAPVSTNGAVKLLNEMVIQEFCNRCSIKYQILRVFNMYGGDDSFSVLSKIENSLIRGDSFTMFNRGESRRDFVHVDDVARIISYFLLNKIDIPVINIGTGRSVKIKELADVFLDKLKVKNKVSIDEAVNSVANIDLLKSVMAYEFRQVLDDVLIMRDRLNGVGK